MISLLEVEEDRGAAGNEVQKKAYGSDFGQFEHIRTASHRPHTVDTDSQEKVWLLMLCDAPRRGELL